MYTLIIYLFIHLRITWRGTGEGGNPGVMGVGSLREAGEKRAGDGIPKGAGAGRKRK